MVDCLQIEPLITPYVDGELDAGDRRDVGAHLGTCAPCRSHADAERSIRTLLKERRLALHVSCAPARLHARCADQCAAAPSWRTRWLGDRFQALAIAASLVLVAGVCVYQATGRSAHLLAAELAADHLKCFLIGPSGTGGDGVDRVLVSHFDWHAELPRGPERMGLELVGARLCVYGQGRVAHIMYRYRGRPVSVFMLPDTERAAGLVDVPGYSAVVWNRDHRTFVLLASEPRADLEQMAAFVQAGLR